MARPSGVYRGEVARVDDSRVWVRVSRLGGSNVYGPCEQVLSPNVPLDGNTGSTAGHSHTITDRPLEAGDRILVAFVEGRSDDIIVLGRLP